MALLITMIVPAAPAGASALDGSSDVVVVVIDTGVRATHSEFASGQFVAWWDFTAENGPVALPGAGDTWDSRWAPYDNNGHGTGTSARVGGATTGGFPGVKLGMAKVGEGDGTISGDLGAAYDWAANVVHADVISISIGTIIPFPGQLDDMPERIHAAAGQGTLTVVSAGNGYGNAGVGPQFTWTTSYGYSRDVVSVGSLFGDGAESVLLTGSGWTPDVSAEGNDVRIACNSNNSCFEQSFGTSFAAPYVAGVAARALSAGLANSYDLGPQYLKDLAKDCSVDMGWTYTLQGSGFVNDDAADAMATAAAAGTTCASHTPGTQAGFADDPARDEVEAASNWGKYAFTGPFGAGGGQVIAKAAGASTATGVLGVSTPLAMEVEVYDLTLARGATGTVTASFLQDGVNDVDLYILPPHAATGGVFVLEDAIAKSAGSGVDETATFRAPAAGTYKVLVVGWTLAGDTPVTVTGATFASQGLYAGQAVF